MQGFETGGSADAATPQEEGAEPPRKRVVVRVAVLAVFGALVALAVGSAVMVAADWQAEPARAPVSQAPLVPPTPGVRAPLPSVAGVTVAEVVANGEAVGARVIVFDARWDRPVGPDWRVCTRGEPVIGEKGIPSGQLHVAAVPPGDPCP